MGIRRSRRGEEHPESWIFGPRRSVRRDLTEAMVENRPPVLGKLLVGGAVVALAASTLTPLSPVAVVTSGDPVASDGDGSEVGVPDGVELTASGSMVVTTDGAVIDGLDVRGRIWVKADDVTIRNTRVAYDSYHSIRLFEGYRGLVVEHVDIECGSATKTKGVVFGNYTARSVEATGCATAFVSTAGNVEVTDSVVDGEPFELGTGTSLPPAPPTTAPAPTSTAPTATTSPPPTPTTVPPTTPGQGFPDESTTGVPAGVGLSPSGSLTVTEDGAVIENLRIDGTVTVQASDVTIRNVVIENTGTYPLDARSAVNLLVEDSEIDGNGQGNVAVYGGEYTLRRVDIHDTLDGPRIEGDNVVIEDSYIHHLHRIPGGHHDTIQLRRGNDVVIRGNNLQPYNPATGDPMNAAIQIGSLNGTMSNLLVEGNLMNGGNYTVNASKSGGSSLYRDNVFGRDARYGILSSGPGVVWENSNVYLDTGQPAR